MNEALDDLRKISKFIRNWVVESASEKRPLADKQFQEASDLLSSLDFTAKIKKGFSKKIEDPAALQEELDFSMDDLQAVQMKAAELQTEGSFMTSKILYQFLTILNPLNVDYWVGLGISFLKLSSFEDARQCFELARTVDKTNPRVIYFLALCLAIINKDEQALSLCDEGLAIESPFWQPHLSELKQKIIDKPPEEL